MERPNNEGSYLAADFAAGRSGSYKIVCCYLPDQAQRKPLDILSKLLDRQAPKLV